MLSALRWAGERPGRGVGQATGASTVHGARGTPRSAARPSGVTPASDPARADQASTPADRPHPATIDAGRVVDKAPLNLGRPDRTERLPDRRGRLVKLPQRFGDHRPLLFEHRDCDREVGPDVVWDQVGQVAWLDHASTSSLDNAWPTSPFRLSPDSTGQRSDFSIRRLSSTGLG